jgi:hypothetical protein
VSLLMRRAAGAAVCTSVAAHCIANVTAMKAVVRLHVERIAMKFAPRR